MKKSTVLVTLALAFLLAACAPTPTATPTAVPPSPVPPTAVPPTAVVLIPTAAPEVPEVPIGNERRDREWAADVMALLYARRVSASDMVGGQGGLAFTASDCMSCHENAPGVEGQIFYGPNFTDFAKDQAWVQDSTDMHGRPDQAYVPALELYDFLKTHLPRVDMKTGEFPEHILRQNP